MTTRTLGVLAIAFQLVTPLHAAPAIDGPGGADPQPPAASCGVCRLKPESQQQDNVDARPAPDTDDIVAGHGPQLYARVLLQIAIYESIGDRDGVEILTAQLRALGLSLDTVRDAVTWAKVHSSPSKPAAPRHERDAAFHGRLGAHRIP